MTALARIRDFVKDLNTPPVPPSDKEYMQGYYFALKQVEQAIAHLELHEQAQAQQYSTAVQHSVAQHTAECNRSAHNK